MSTHGHRLRTRQYTKPPSQNASLYGGSAGEAAEVDSPPTSDASRWAHNSIVLFLLLVILLTPSLDMPWTATMCLRMVFTTANSCLQTGHRVWPSCFFMWELKLRRWAYLFPQMWHVNGPPEKWKWTCQRTESVQSSSHQSVIIKAVRQTKEKNKLPWWRNAVSVPSTQWNSDI